MASKPTTIDEYLASLEAKTRVVLEKLRKTIRGIAPTAEECLSYGVPAFRLNGMLVGFGATENHCSLYLMNGTTVAAFQEELKDHDVSKGTIRFPADAPLSVTLVKKLVKARVAENESRSRTARTTSKAKSHAARGKR